MWDQAGVVAVEQAQGGNQGGGYGKVMSPSNINASNVLTIQIGSGGSTNATYLKDNTSTVICQGDYGASASGLTGANRAQSNIGATLTNSGGSGGTPNFASDGGGAGGPNGQGKAGGALTGENVGGGGGGCKRRFSGRIG